MSMDKEMHDLKMQLQSIQDRLKSLAEEAGPETVEEMKGYVDQASTFMKEYVDQTASTLKDKWESTKAVGTEKGKQVQEYAQENPWHIAAAGAMIGIAVASLLKGKDKE